MSRRPDGALESDIMAVLWDADRALTPADVRDRLPSQLAYTTVMTVLGRLVDKGLLLRSQRGRAFAYTPALSQAELTAQRMGDALNGAKDRASALTGFVERLSKRDAQLLRQAVEDLGPR